MHHKTDKFIHNKKNIERQNQRIDINKVVKMYYKGRKKVDSILDCKKRKITLRDLTMKKIWREKKENLNGRNLMSLPKRNKLMKEYSS